MKNSDELIYSEVKRQLVEQSNSIRSIDTKSALVLSFVGAILAGLVNSSWFNSLSNNYHFIILLPLGLTCIASLSALLVRSYRSDPDPSGLISGYMNKPEEKTRGQLIKNFEDVFSNNKPTIKNKALLCKTAFVLLTLATIAIIMAILFAPNNTKGDATWQMMQHPRRTMYRLNQ